MPLFPVQDVSSLDSVTLDVAGMKCAGCVQVVERQLKQHPGVASASVNLVTAVAAVEFHRDRVDGKQLAEKLTESGFPSQPRNQGTMGSAILSPQDRYDREHKTYLRELAIAATLLILSFLGHRWPHLPILGSMAVHGGLATLALVFPGREIIVDGARGWWQNTPNMNSLVGLGAIAAYSTSAIALLFPQLGWECFFDEPVMLLGFILLGRTLEARAKSQAAADLSALLALQPQRAHLISPDAGDEVLPVDIAAATVKVGEWLRVLPGERFPVDGRVVKGETTVNESMITGESTPVSKSLGDGVTAGTINESGTVTIETVRIGSDTTLGQIIRWVESAQTQKAPIQRLADRVAAYFVYGMLAIATLTFLFWVALGVRIWPEVLLAQSGEMVYSPVLPVALKLAIAVLVIACPCALGLATPTALLVGTGFGAKQGILIKGGATLEQLHRINLIVFDKTGTLTQGYPTVTDCFPNTDLNWTADQLLAYAAAVEQGANHPLARAILSAAPAPARLAGERFQTFPGLGVQGWVDQQHVLLGSPDWLVSEGIDLPLPQGEMEGSEQGGKTVIYMAVNGQWVGCIALHDPLRVEAREVIDELQRMGIEVMIITGDRPPVAQTVAQALGLAPEAVLASILPSGKAEAIARWQQSGRKVAMVGDGINDAPAIAQADVGITLQNATDVALDTAQVVLIGSLTLLPKAIRLSEATFRTIRQNLFWAFGYNLLAIPLAAGVLLPSWGIVLSPATAAALMAVSSVTVVTNSLLLGDRYRTSQSSENPLK